LISLEAGHRPWAIGHRHALIALVAGAAACAGVLFITEPLGPGLDPDARGYLYAAGTLAHSGTLRDVRDNWVSSDSTRSLTRWPPAFPAAIAVTIALGAPPVQGARAVIALSAFAAMAILVWLACSAAGSGAGIVLAILMLVSPPLAFVHESVLSEPLFLALLAATLALMVRATPAPLAEGATAAAASLVRYAGLAFVGAVVAWELLRAGTWRERMRRASLAALPAIVVNAWWWTRAARAGGRSAVRHFSVYGAIGDTLREGGGTIVAWLAPGLVAPAGVIVSVVFVVAIAVVAGLGVRRSALEGGSDARGTMPDALVKACGVLIVAYMALILLARMVADPDIPLDDRLLAPAIALVMVAVVVAVAGWRHAAPRAVGALGAAALIWAYGSFVVTRDAVRYALRTGSDYADICWSGSPVTAWVRDHGAGHALLSNAPIALYFQSGRLAREMPDEMQADSLRAFADTLVARNSYVVVFDRSCAETIEPPDPVFMGALGLVSEAVLRRGTIWRMPDRTPPAAPR
jgi:hypothetical protein